MKRKREIEAAIENPVSVVSDVHQKAVRCWKCKKEIDWDSRAHTLLGVTDVRTSSS